MYNIFNEKKPCLFIVTLIPQKGDGTPCNRKLLGEGIKTWKHPLARDLA